MRNIPHLLSSAQLIQQLQQQLQLRLIQPVHYRRNGFPVPRQLLQQQALTCFSQRNDCLTAILCVSRPRNIAILLQRSQQQADVGFGYRDSLSKQ